MSRILIVDVSRLRPDIDGCRVCVHEANDLKWHLLSSITSGRTELLITARPDTTMGQLITVIGSAHTPKATTLGD